MNFNSQVCTSRKQSERLLALGLKKETADMCWSNVLTNGNREWLLIPIPIQAYTEMEIPAWSLHRLIEMIQSVFIRVTLCDWWVQIIRRPHYEEYYGTGHNNLYDNIIDCIEYLIKEGYFNNL